MSPFGSALREDFGHEEDFGRESDIDVLVEFEAGHGPGFFGLFDMQEELSSIFGRTLDLRTPDELSRYFRDEVVSQAEVMYAQK